MNHALVVAIVLAAGLAASFTAADSPQVMHQTDESRADALLGLREIDEDITRRVQAYLAAAQDFGAEVEWTREMQMLLTISRPPLNEIHPRRVIDPHNIDPLPTAQQYLAVSPNSGLELAELERLIGDPDFLPADFVVEAARVQSCVCRIVFKRRWQDPMTRQWFFPGDGWGTGFMVSPTLMITNNHVLNSAEFAQKHLRAEFNYQRGLDGEERQTTTYEFDAPRLFHTNARLDYTLVRLAPEVGDATPDPGHRWGFYSLAGSENVVALKHMSLNIVQHPDGGHKKVVIRNNLCVGTPKLDGRRPEQNVHDFVLYTADTLPGSSGSPVFDDRWRLVAVHHSAGEKVGEQWKNNEGVLATSIIENLRAAVDRDVLAELGLVSKEDIR